MSNEIVRSRRLRKKLYLDEFAILGFEFTCKIVEVSEQEYDAFFNALADQMEERDLFLSIDGQNNHFEGFVTSGERYGSASEDDRKAIEKTLTASTIVSDVVVGPLVDAFYEI
ncbi:YggL 50S ribosome-binding family protein [Teredinibacter franksiae]|jgi:Uncharacterized protein conserved in bacteria|uniref:YggL 50S ribosome-binding family protein n=1 Tax=Teredinibacter franksiae TaxID=2761453 RepID=UPI001625835B|nr:YggL family protein [Teredinibacter franksiae]